jgi:hypothetical protein
MTTKRDDPIDDYIAANWIRYSRDAINQHLVAAGYDKALIDEAWERLAAAESAPRAPAPQASRAGITGYVITSFVVGLLAVLGLILFNLRSLTATLQFEVIWVVGYIVVGAIVGYFITRFRVAGGWWVLAAPLVPILYIVVWFGTCLAAYRSL